MKQRKKFTRTYRKMSPWAIFNLKALCSGCYAQLLISPLVPLEAAIILVNTDLSFVGFINLKQIYLTCRRILLFSMGTEVLKITLTLFLHLNQLCDKYV